MDSGKKGKMRGTFAAVEEQIPYLKALGVTTLELMPVYEFEEIEIPKKQKLPGYIPQGCLPEKKTGSETEKDNTGADGTEVRLKWETLTTVIRNII